MSAARARGEGPSAAYWTGVVSVVGALALPPLVLPEFWQRFATEILIWGLLAMSSDLLIGYTGMVSFGHSAFFGLGMYGAAAALLAVRPPSLWLALLTGLVAAAVVAMFVGFLSSRVCHTHFPLTTLPFIQNLHAIIFTERALLGRDDCVPF